MKGEYTHTKEIEDTDTQEIENTVDYFMLIMIGKERTKEKIERLKELGINRLEILSGDGLDKRTEEEEPERINKKSIIG